MENCILSKSEIAAARQKNEKSSAGADSSCPRLIKTIKEIEAAAIGGLSGEKINEIARPWLVKADLDLSLTGAFRLAEAMVLASYVALFTPSLTGVTPLARFIGQKRAGADAETLLALDALSHANFYLLRIKSRLTPHTLMAENLINDDGLILMDEEISATLRELDAGVWLAPLPSGQYAVLGPFTPLDEKTRAEGMAFARAKRLSNPRRCAAAIYRSVVRFGGLRIEGLNLFSDDLLKGDGFEGDGFEGEYGEPDVLDSLVASYLKDANAASTMQEVRRLALPENFIEALSRCVMLREYGEPDTAAGFLAVAFIMLETMDRRANVGHHCSTQSLEAIAAFLAREIAEHDERPQTAALFEQLRQRLINARGARLNENKLAVVLQRIQALRAKTVAQGCTEQEALAAAKKVAELLDRYGLSLSEVELREQPCEGVGVDTGRRNTTPLIQCAPTIAEFCDCKVWFEKTEGGFLRFIFFGLPADAAAAHYLYDLVALAFKTETARFRTQPPIDPSQPQRARARSFELGLAQGICVKLNILKAERDAANQLSSGRDLVPIKESVVEDELEKLGLSFHAKTKSRKGASSPDAFAAGFVAGQTFEPRAGIKER